MYLIEEVAQRVLLAVVLGPVDLAGSLITRHVKEGAKGGLRGEHLESIDLGTAVSLQVPDFYSLNIFQHCHCLRDGLIMSHPLFSGSQT